MEELRTYVFLGSGLSGQLAQCRRLPCQGRPYYTDGAMSIILNEEKEAIKIGLNGIDDPGKRQDFKILSKCGANGELTSLLPLFFARCNFNSKAIL
jgi:hypothetical protein